MGYVIYIYIHNIIYVCLQGAKQGWVATAAAVQVNCGWVTLVAAKWNMAFFKRYKKSIYLNDERSHLLYISSFFKYFPDTTTRLLSSDGNKNIVNLLLPWGRYIERRWVSVSWKPSLYTHTHILLYPRSVYRLGGFIFILTLEMVMEGFSPSTAELLGIWILDT